MRSCVEDGGELKDREKAETTTQGQTGEDDVDDKDGDSSLVQFSVDGHAILLVRKR